MVFLGGGCHPVGQWGWKDTERIQWVGHPINMRPSHAIRRSISNDDSKYFVFFDFSSLVAPPRLPWLACKDPAAFTVM